MILKHPYFLLKNQKQPFPDTQSYIYDCLVQVYEWYPPHTVLVRSRLYWWFQVCNLWYGNLRNSRNFKQEKKKGARTSQDKPWRWSVVEGDESKKKGSLWSSFHHQSDRSELSRSSKEKDHFLSQNYLVSTAVLFPNQCRVLLHVQCLNRVHPKCDQSPY